MSYNAQLRSNNVIRNHEGGEAWMQSHEFELYSTVACTMSIDDKFYESAADRINRIAALVRRVPAEFVAQLAIYARTELQLRSVPMLLLVELSECHSGDSLVSRATAKTIQRVDDIIELLACYQMRRGVSNLKRLSHQLRRGIAKAFCKFDEYQFAKYKAQDKPITLRDALFIAHPKAENEQQQELFDKIARQQLQPPYTWETRVSEVGRTKGFNRRKRRMRQVWTELIESRRMGYMAMLRNLRNMLGASVKIEPLQKACDYLSSEQAVLNSKLLPFRFFSAYLMFQSTNYEYMRRWNRFVRLYIGGLWLKYHRERILQFVDKLQHRHYSLKKRKVVRRRQELPEMARMLIKLGVSSEQHWHRADMVTVKWLRCTRTTSHLSKFIAYKQKQAEKLEGYISQRYKRWVKNMLIKQKRVKMVQECLEAAVKHSAANIPAFDADTRVCIGCDASGSIYDQVSSNSILRCNVIGLLLGAMLKQRCKEAVVGMYASKWLPVELPSDNILKNVIDMRSKAKLVGGGSDGCKVIDWLCEKQQVMDKVLLFTDSQLWDSSWRGDSLSHTWAEYKRTIAPNAKLYIFDLAGYGQNPINVDHENDVYMIAGWSDKVFHMLAALEKGSSAIDEIRRIVI